LTEHHVHVHVPAAIVIFFLLERFSEVAVQPMMTTMQVTAGSADRMVYVWNATTRQIEYKLPGHLGSVNDAVFHPKEPIVASASSDKQIYLGELSKWS